MDVVFAFDASDSTSDDSFVQFKTFLQNAVKAYEISAEKVRVGLLLFGSQTQIVVSLERGDNQDYVVQAIKTMRKQGKLI